MSLFKKAKQRWKPTMTRSFQRSELRHAEICGAQSWWGFLIRFSRVHHEVRTGFWSRNCFDNIYLYLHIYTLPQTNLHTWNNGIPPNKKNFQPSIFQKKKQTRCGRFREGTKSPVGIHHLLYQIHLDSNGSMLQGKIKILTSWFTTTWCKKNISNCWICDIRHQHSVSISKS